MSGRYYDRGLGSDGEPEQLAPVGVDCQCRRCGGDVGLVNAGRSLFQGAEVNGVVRCTSCQAAYLLHVTMTPVADAEIVCGTNAGYLRHSRRGEPTCVPCRRAHAAAVQERTAKRKARLQAVGGA